MRSAQVTCVPALPARARLRTRARRHPYFCQELERLCHRFSRNGHIRGDHREAVLCLNDHPELSAPNGESFRDFYDRYERRLKNILAVAEESTGYVVAVTHVRNLLAAKTILTHGDRDRVPVKGGPSTGTLTFVEKVDGVWTMHSKEAQPMPLIPVPNEPGAVHDVFAN